MFIRRLKDLREDSDITQTQVAKILGIQQNVYSRYETGVRTLPIEYLIVLAGLYETTTDYILGLTNEKASCNKTTKSK